MIEIFADEEVQEEKKEEIAPAQRIERPVPQMKHANQPKKRDIKVEVNKKSHPVPAGQLCSSKCPRRGRNILKKYINRFYKLCLLNLAAAITMLIIYKETGNEMIVPAIYACAANGLLTYMCVD